MVRHPPAFFLRHTIFSTTSNPFPTLLRSKKYALQHIGRITNEKKCND